MTKFGETQAPYWVYKGDGTTLRERNLAPPEFVDRFPSKTEFYRADLALAHAVNAAISLGIPLLVSGEPGTGKTQLAASVARELMFAGPFVFNCKTTSTARDLFYVYDGLRHYRDVLIYSKSGSGDPPRARSYIRFSALGQAILLARQGEGQEKAVGAVPKRSVVLIGEFSASLHEIHCG